MNSNHITPKISFPPKPKRKPTFRKTGPLEYRVWNYDGDILNGMEDLYATGGTIEKYQPGPLDTSTTREARKRAQDAWVEYSRTEKPDQHPYVTVWLDNQEIMERARINKRSPQVFKAIRMINNARHKVPMGLSTMRSLASGPFADDINIVGYDIPRKVAKNDTAQGGRSYWSLPL